MTTHLVLNDQPPMSTGGIDERVEEVVAMVLLRYGIPGKPAPDRKGFGP